MQTHSPFVAHDDGKNNYSRYSLSIYASVAAVSALPPCDINKGVTLSLWWSSKCLLIERHKLYPQKFLTQNLGFVLLCSDIAPPTQQSPLEP